MAQKCSVELFLFLRVILLGNKAHETSAPWSHKNHTRLGLHARTILVTFDQSYTNIAETWPILFLGYLVSISL